MGSAVAVVVGRAGAAVRVGQGGRSIGRVHDQMDKLLAIAEACQTGDSARQEHDGLKVNFVSDKLLLQVSKTSTQYCSHQL
jgi:hypothetical protein